MANKNSQRFSFVSRGSMPADTFGVVRFKGFEGLSTVSLAKARLVDTSLKGANLFQVDFLRSTFSNTAFDGSNLDGTIIEHWRPS